MLAATVAGALPARAGAATPLPLDLSWEAPAECPTGDAVRAQRFLRSAIERAPQRGASITVFDPAPMSLARLAGVERAQVLLQSRSRPRLQAFLREWSDGLYRMPTHGVRWHLDVDPIEF